MKGRCIIKRLDEKYEYRDYEELEGLASKYFYIPHTLIRDTELGDKRISVFAYLSMYRGLNNRMFFSMPHFLQWAHYKSDTHAGGINDKIIDTLDRLNDEGYLTYGNGTLSRTGNIEIIINTDFIVERCSDGGYGAVYCDEIEKIMNYSNNIKKDTYFNCNTVLMVFAFLRDAIIRMPNELKVEERYPDRIEDRRKRNPEAYNESYKNIAEILGISVRGVSNSVKILEELGLIVIEEAYHFKNDDDEYRTPDVIFANTYKREGNKLLTFDESYAREQILNKEALMQKYFKGYLLKKNTPLFKKVS